MWMHHMETDKTPTGKARSHLHNNGKCCFKQILEATINKSTHARTLTSHFKKHPSKTDKTYGTLVQKQERTHKYRSSLEPSILMCQGYPTSKNLHQQCANTKCSLKDFQVAMVDRTNVGESRNSILSMRLHDNSSISLHF